MVGVINYVIIPLEVFIALVVMVTDWMMMGGCVCYWGVKMVQVRNLQKKLKTYLVSTPPPKKKTRKKTKSEEKKLSRLFSCFQNLKQSILLVPFIFSQ